MYDNEDIHNIISNLSYLKDTQSLDIIYFNEDKTPKELGTIITNPKLAKTFEIIAKEGIDPFYKGQIAKDIIN